MEKKTLVLLGILIAVALVATGWWGVLGARAQAATEACVNNLRAIHGIKDQWALENAAELDATPAWADLKPYCRGMPPECPRGGAYTIGRLDQLPFCSVAEHTCVSYLYVIHEAGKRWNSGSGPVTHGAPAAGHLEVPWGLRAVRWDSLRCSEGGSITTGRVDELPSCLVKKHTSRFRKIVLKNQS